jgi:hypothetical protein
MHTGRPFSIFQDRNDIEWGQQWAQMIANSLADVNFLIPILTPSFFESPACRSEFDTFLLREQTLGLNRLILPILYLDCDQLQNYGDTTDPIVKSLLMRNWFDWRQLRFMGFDDAKVAAELSNMAKMIKHIMRDLDSIIAKSNSVKLVAPQENRAEPELADADTTSPADTSYVLPEARPGTEFDKAVIAKVRQNEYYAYTRRFDERINAADLAEPGELMQLVRYVTRATSGSDNKYGSLTRQLSNRIKRLPDPPSVSISLLLDNSGSMRGEKIVSLAGAMIVLIDWLERWHIGLHDPSLEGRAV